MTLEKRLLDEITSTYSFGSRAIWISSRESNREVGMRIYAVLARFVDARI